MPMFRPLGWLTSVRNFSTVSILSRGSPDPHQHDVGDRLPAVQLGEEDLVHHLCRRKVPHLASQGGSAESTAHPAAHLTGDTHSIPMLIPHQNRLDAVSV